MKFGEILKEIRIKNGDSLRRLSEKIGTPFTYIDRVEKGVNPPSETMIEGLLKTYPLQKKILSKAYSEEKLPINVLKELNISDINEDFLDDVLHLIKMLDIEEQKSILYNILEKIDYLSLKSGNYNKVENLIEDVKNKINELK
jgi:lexA repressor|nr:MAG TPA: helix-turn-helix domain protein [Caudoviricetes sp.]